MDEPETPPAPSDADTPHAPPAAPPPEPSAPEEGRGGSDGRIVIKKYANRRLYNTGSSCYVTLEHLAELVRQGVDFVVYDARTNEDLTRQVLTQIIFEAENSGQNMLPIQFLRQLIQLYGQQVQAFVPGYLEMSLAAFTREQDRLRERFGAAFAPPGFAGSDGYRLIEEQVRQNMAMFDRAMKMFTPFGYARAGEGQAAPSPATAKAAPAAAPPTPGPGPDAAIDEMKARLDEMQRQIARLTGG